MPPSRRARVAAAARPSPLPLALAGGALLLAAALAWSPARAQPAPVAATATAAPVTAAQKAEVVGRLAEALRERYVFPETGAKVAAELEAKLAAGAFDAMGEPLAFARGVTDLIMPLAGDKHLRVRHASAPRKGTPAVFADPARHNHGFVKVERLPGNIGYIKLDAFIAPRSEARAVADKAMAQLAGADALIVDLRENGGGSPEMVAYLSGYLFAERTHLNDLYFRHPGRTTGSTTEFWAEPRGNVSSFAGKPVYVLTAGYTFSGAEEFANNLKALQRATLVGETTGGGANPGNLVDLGHGFSAFVPDGRAINPITKTNWEGTGVEPDVKVPAAQALDAALSRARADLAARS
ncbi:MAG TPA: S41 family peptidase [Azospirillaceae bacterium]|nr:S41 family peptidase [Azospirillaceae bacterium]